MRNFDSHVFLRNRLIITALDRIYSFYTDIHHEGTEFTEEDVLKYAYDNFPVLRCGEFDRDITFVARFFEPSFDRFLPND